MKTAKGFLFILLASAAIFSCACAQEYPYKSTIELKAYDITRVLGVSGDAELVRGGARMPLKRDAQISDGDMIKTGAGGLAVIGYLTDSMIVLWPGSKIEITFAGRTSQKQKAFAYKHVTGRVYNKIGASTYYGQPEVDVYIPGGIVAAKSAEFCTVAEGGYTAVRNGSVELSGKGFKQTVKSGKYLRAAGGAPAPLSESAYEEFLLAGQYMVMAGRGEPLRSTSLYYQNPATAYSSYYSGVPTTPNIVSPAYTNNEIQAAQEYGAPYAGSDLTAGMPPKNKDLSTSDRVMGGDLPYFPPERLGAARNPDKDYGLNKPEPIKTPIVPGDTTDSELWPELFPEDDGYLKELEPSYPFPEDGEKPKPLPAVRKKAESLRTVEPPPINAVTPRSGTSPQADFKGAYKICQNYAFTQTEVDDCVMKHIKPEKVPGVVEFPEPPPELNLPMSHEPEAPMYVSLPPVSEIPPPAAGVSALQLPTCRYSVMSDYSLSGNDIGIRNLEQGRFASALESFEDSLRINPESADLLNNIGITYMRMGDASRAEKFLKRAIGAEPGRAELHNNLGCVLFAAGKTNQACNEWTLVLKQSDSALAAEHNRVNFCR